MAVAVLLIPCFFGMIQIRDLITSAKGGRLKCPVGRNERRKVDCAA